MITLHTLAGSFDWKCYIPLGIEACSAFNDEGDPLRSNLQSKREA
jgi:hypothetical protein